MLGLRALRFAARPGRAACVRLAQGRQGQLRAAHSGGKKNVDWVLRAQNQTAEAPGTVLEHQTVQALSGLPVEQLQRTAMIYQPSKVATQSGPGWGDKWRVEFPGADRWQNPLMGWTSSGDPLSSLKLHFDTLEEAIDYCRRNGFKWDMEEAIKRDMPSISYDTNFKYRPPPKDALEL